MFAKNMKPLWKVNGFFNRTSWKVSDVQIVCETWVLVANDTSNHPVADSLRSVPSLEESGTCMSVQCSEYQSGEKFKQTRVKGGSIYDSLKETSSGCQSNGNLKQALVNGGRSHDSLKVASTLNFQSDGNSNTRCSI